MRTKVLAVESFGGRIIRTTTAEPVDEFAVGAVAYYRKRGLALEHACGAAGITAKEYNAAVAAEAEAEADDFTEGAVEYYRRRGLTEAQARAAVA